MVEKIIYEHFGSLRQASDFVEDPASNKFGPLENYCVAARNQKKCAHEHGKFIMTSLCYSVNQWSDFGILPSQQALEHILKHLTKYQV